MILSHFAFPVGQTACQDLYYRGEAQIISGNKLQIKNGKKIEFNTYFNGFFYGPYTERCDIEEVILNVTVSGRIRLSAIVAGGKSEKWVLAELCVVGNCDSVVVTRCRLEDLPVEGVLYLEAEALSEAACIHAGTIETERKTTEPVKVAAIVCTYKREKYVYRNIEKVQREIWDCKGNPIQKELDFFIVDNGQTLSMAPKDHVTLFYNKNYGGSGGFTRGLIEAYRRRDAYTHVLLMDDDIAFETESLFRTIQFLKLLRQREKPVVIGGQMLMEDRPYLQYASGSRYINGRASTCGENIDLSKVENLLPNMRKSPAQFNAWWYCCFPLSVIDRIGLPLPFFIKTDDIEYGLRMDAELVLLNGVGVWHMPFTNKYSPHLEYYIKRNELITSAVHNNGAGVGNSVYKLVRSFVKSILRREPIITDYVLMAYRDFMEGPEFLLRLDEEQQNEYLLKIKKGDYPGTVKGAVRNLAALFSTMAALVRSYKRVQEEYKWRIKELTSFLFWCDHLDIPPVEGLGCEKR